VLRHAPGAHVRVNVRSTSEGVDVVVTNGRPSSSGSGPGSSRGLVGIRERVTALAGTVAWGPRSDGGFEVRAHLPTPVRETVG
jgi:signal transduction histidine kinase